MQTTTNIDRDTNLGMAIDWTRRSAQRKIDQFTASLRKHGVAHAIRYGAADAAIVAEKIVEMIDRVVAKAENDGLDAAIAYVAAVRDQATTQMGYFDPTSQSTSVASTLVAAAEFLAHRRAFEAADEMIRAHQMDLDG